MFITTSDGELAFYNDLLGAGGGQYWSYVEIAQHTPWLCVDIFHEEDGTTIRRTIHFSDIKSFAALSDVDGVTIDRVDLVLPSHYTGEDGWTMLPLHSIWCGTIPNGARRHVYVTQTGKRYSDRDSESGLHECDLVDRHLIFHSRVRPAQDLPMERTD